MDIKPRIPKRNIDFTIRQRTVADHVPRTPISDEPVAIKSTIPGRLQKILISRRAITSLTLCAVIVLQVSAAAILPSLLNTDKYYKLTDQSKSVVGELNQKLSDKITFDAKNQVYQYNKQAGAGADPGSPEAALAAAESAQKVGGGSDNYSVDLSVDPTKGVTVRDASDKSGSLAVSLVPEFTARDGKQVDGRVIYPLRGIDGHLVYSVKANGLKEDIVINKRQGNELSFSYQLKVPDSMQARLLDNGEIGVYASDPSLFGNISFGSDADREKVENARKNGDKNHLVFSIPAPVVVQTDKGSDQVKSTFMLEGTKLTVKTTGLEKASYPLSIDPSVAVTSASDFTKGNFEGGIEFDTSNNTIKRAGLTGGTVTSWSTDSTDVFATRVSHATVAYNGYIYVLGGCTDGGSYGVCNTDTNSVEYATINSDGTIGTWASTTVLASFNTRSAFVAVAYNSYMYVIGGCTSLGGNNCGGFTNSVHHAPIRADGTLGTWVNNPTLGTSRYGHGAAVYNGYLYVSGGCSSILFLACNGYLSDVRYAPINADGSVGSWAAAGAGATLPAARTTHSMVAYNGYAYVMGGTDNTGAVTNTVYYAPINADGTIGTWATTSSLAGIAGNASAIAYKGYIYTFGGYGATTLGTTQYASINADGTLGVWDTSIGMPSARYGTGGGAEYNGRLYLTGGGNANGTDYNNTLFTSVDPAGVTGDYTVDSDTFASASYGATTVANNGYLYVIGGCSVSGCGTTENKVRYAAINADGSIGAFTTDASGTQPQGRYGHASFAYNGRLYVVGGCTGAVGVCVGFQNTIWYSSDTYTSGNPDGNWTEDTTNPFATARFFHGAVVHNDKLYVVGGCSAAGCNGYQNDVQYATINSGGDVGTFSGFGNFDSVGRYGLGVAVYGSYLYVSGGFDSNSAVKSDVRYAEINPSTGAIVGSWGDAGNSFTTARLYHTMAIDKGYMYIAGGCTDSSCGTTLSSAQYALMNNNGTIGQFTDTTSLNTARHSAGATVYRGNVYIAGGCTAAFCSGSFLGNVEYAPINNGGPGATSAWSATTPTNFGNPRYGNSSVAYNGFLYTTGGFDSVTVFDSVLYAPISSDGTVGSWAATTNFPAARFFHTANIHNGYMYVVGGRASGAGLNSTVYYALMCTGQNNGIEGCGATAGTVGTWNTTTVLPNTRGLHSSTVANGYMYVAGGCISTGIVGECTSIPDSIIYALVCTGQNNGVGGCGATPGTVGTWNTSPNTFTNGRNYPSLVASNSYLYLVGGCNINCSTSFSDVQVAKVNTDGTVDPWSPLNSLPEARNTSLVSVYNGYLYVAAGATGNTPLNSVRYAAINSNGTIGMWDQGTNLTVARLGFGSTVYQGRLYIVAGGTNTSFTSGTFRQDVEVAGLKSIDRKGTYSYMHDLAGDAKATKLLCSGTSGGGSRLGFGVRSSVVSTATFGSTTSLPTLRCGSLFTLPTTESRYRQLVFTLDDSGSGVFPDSLSAASTFTDFELYFRAATTAPADGGSKRLRGGKTFTTEQQRSLDAQPQ